MLSITLPVRNEEAPLAGSPAWPSSSVDLPTNEATPGLPMSPCPESVVTQMGQNTTPTTIQKPGFFL